MENPKRFTFNIGLLWVALIFLFPVGLVLAWFFLAKPLLAKRASKSVVLDVRSGESRE